MIHLCAIMMEVELADEEMEIDDANEEMEVDEMSDEDDVLSNDTAIDSDIDDDDIVEIKYRDLTQNEVNTLDDLKKMCCIYFYYTGTCAKFCAKCMLQLSGLFSRLRAVRKHVTEQYILIDKHFFCSNCRNPLYQIMPCNLCPICTK